MVTVAQVIDVLKLIGYSAVSDEEKTLIEYMKDVTEREILNQCNITEVPEELDMVVINRTCGAFLEAKSAVGTLATTLNIDMVAKKIVEGDTTVEFATSDSLTPQKALNNFIRNLKEYGKRDVAAFRKMRW